MIIITFKMGIDNWHSTFNLLQVDFIINSKLVLQYKNVWYILNLNPNANCIFHIKLMYQT